MARLQRWLISLMALTAPPALACGWYYETFAAETGTLPCVEPVALGLDLGHSTLVLERSLDVAELAGGLFPSAPEVLDARVNLSLKLGRIDAGVQLARVRAALAPGEYTSHANLGTALTLAGDVSGALREVRAALALEPAAHFGQERVHLQLLEYLERLGRDPSLAEREDLFGLSPDSPADAGVPVESREALVAMLGVSGGRGNPHLLFALGNVLRLEGRPLLAFQAWRGALRAGHPSKRVIAEMERINTAQHERWRRSPESERDRRPRHDDFTPARAILDESHWQFDDGWAGLWWSARHREELLGARRDAFFAWEATQLKLGLPFWTEAGARLAVQQQERFGLRCPTVTPVASSPAPEVLPRRSSTPTPRGLAWLDAVAGVTSQLTDLDGCASQVQRLTEGFSRLGARASADDRASVLGEPKARERLASAFDRMALVLARCAPGRGNGKVLTAWLGALAREP